MNTLAQTKRDFEIGYLSAYRLERAPMSEGWQIYLGSGNAAGWLVDARSKQPRIFKTLDAAIKTLEEIGFKVLVLH